MIVYLHGGNIVINILLWDEKEDKVNNQIVKYVNKNIREVIRVLLDIMEDDPYFEIDFLFTRDRYQRQTEKCRNSIYELYDLISSTVVRDYIKPNYEFLLFNILSWWIECHDDDEDLLCFPLDKQLKDNINSSSTCDEKTKKYVINVITDFNEYIGFVFEDLDFLPDQVNKMGLLYMDNPTFARMFYHYDELIDFLDLMDCDIKERYLEQIKTHQFSDEDKESVAKILETLTVFLENSKIYNEKDSYEAVIRIIDNYKHWIEYCRGANVLAEVPSKTREKIVQYTLHGTALNYCQSNNWDISPEVDSGRGPEDFKISRGNDKTVVEIKLTSNPNCVHGLEVQIEQYAKAENSKNKVFVLIDNGINSNRVQDVLSCEVRLKSEGKSPAKVIVIDAKLKASASKYNAEN